MAKPYKFKADFSALDKAFSVQKALNKALDVGNKLLNKSDQAIKTFSNSAIAAKNAVTGNLENALEQSRAEAIGLAMEGKRIQANFAGAKAGFLDKLVNVGKDPFGVLIKGAGLLKTALMAVGKVTWIGILTAAIFVFKRVWDANIGGIQTTFSKVMGHVLDVFGRVTAAFYAFVEEVGPLVTPLFEGIANLLIPVIDGIGMFVEQFLKGGGAAKAFGQVVMPVLNAVFNLFGTVFGIITKIVKKFAEAGPTGENSLGKLFKSVGKLLGVVVNLVGKIFEFLDSIGVFDALVFIVKLLAEGLSVVADLISWIVDGLIKAFDWASKLFKKNKENEDVNAKNAEANEQTNKAVQETATTQEEAVARTQNFNNRSTTINNNPSVTVNSSGPISAESAPMIGDVLAKSVSVQRGVL